MPPGNWGARIGFGSLFDPPTTSFRIFGIRGEQVSSKCIRPSVSRIEKVNISVAFVLKNRQILIFFRVRKLCL